MHCAIHDSPRDVIVLMQHNNTKHINHNINIYKRSLGHAIRVSDTLERWRSRRRRRLDVDVDMKTGAGDSLFARLNNTLYNVYSNEDFTVISLRLSVP